MVFKKKMSETIKEEIDGEEEDDEDDSPAVRAARELARPIQSIQQPVKKELLIRPIVVPQLPTKTYRKIIDQNTGDTFEAVTFEEVFQELLESIREIKKAVV